MHKKPYLIETEAEFAFHWGAMLAGKRILKVPKELALTVSNDGQSADSDFYFIGQVRCSICNNQHTSAWPTNLSVPDDEQECVACRAFTCAPQTDEYQEIYWA